MAVDLQKLLRYSKSTAIVASLKVTFSPSAIVFPINLVLYLKDLKTFLITNYH